MRTSLANILWLLLPTRCLSFAPPSRRSSSSSRVVTFVVAPSSVVADRDDAAARLVERAASVGRVGSRATQEERDEMAALAETLSAFSDPAPARKELAGVHELLYSAAPGGSSGAIGPFLAGDVTQTFADETRFCNAVRLGGLEIRLDAERRVLDDHRARVVFKETIVSVFGVELLRKKTEGQGVWKHLFAGEVEYGGNLVFLRVLETPSLFVIKQDVDL